MAISLTERFGWVVYLDVYGFTALVKGGNPTQIHERLLQCETEITRILRRSAVKKFTFSDSTLLFFPAVQKKKLVVLKRCLELVAVVMGVFIRKHLPLRGGISYGSVTLGEGLLIGEPVIHAVQYESIVNGPFVLLPAKELAQYNPLTSFNPDLPPIILITLNDGNCMSGTLVCPFPREDLANLASEQFMHHSVHGPFTVAKMWKDTLDLLRQTSPSTPEVP